MAKSSNSSPYRYSEAWRAQEAKDIFSLLQNEYMNSKQLSIIKRYKELERIIKMFISEPVLIKLRWLSSADVDDLSTLDCETDNEVDTENDQSPDRCSNITWQKRRVNSVDKFLDGLKKKVSSKVKSSSLANTFSFSKFTPPIRSAISVDSDTSSRCFSLDQDSSYSPLGYPSSPIADINSPTGSLLSPALSTHCCFVFNTMTPSTSETKSCRAIMCSNGNISDDSSFYGFPSNVETSSSSLKSSTSDEKCSTIHRVPSRSRGIENYVIKRNEIPQFQIPPKRVFSSRKLSMNIDHSLYLQSSPKTLTCKRSGLTLSLSSPNILDNRKEFTIKRLLKGDKKRKRCCPDDCLRISKENKKVREASTYLPRFPTGDSSKEKSISCNMDTYYLEAFNSLHGLMKAYESLTKMKIEFERLNDKNFLGRYRKMKTMIKSCMNVQC